MPPNRRLSLLDAYGLAALGAIVGVPLRLLFISAARLPPYHCFDWQPQAAISLVVYLVVAPLGAGFVRDRARAIVVCIIALLALVLATFLWSYTSIVPCSPL
jgi:hypothetical protein